MSLKRVCDLDGTVIDPETDVFFTVVDGRGGKSKDVCYLCARIPETEILWSANTFYEVGERIAKSTGRGDYVWDVIVAGVSGTTEPPFANYQNAAAIGTQFVDGTVTYVTPNAPTGYAIVHVEGPGMTTATLSMWGWVNGIDESA